jgi:hypothetical protein
MDRFALGTIAQEQEVEDEQSTHTWFCAGYNRTTILVSLLPLYSEGAELNELIKNSHDDPNDPCHPTVQSCCEWAMSVLMHLPRHAMARSDLTAKPAAAN